MRTLSYGQRLFMTRHIADGLRELKIDVTPELLERELAHMDTMLRNASTSDEFAPPDPYEAGLKNLRDGAGGVKATAVRPPKTSVDANAIPDPYAEGLKALRAQEHSR